MEDKRIAVEMEREAKKGESNLENKRMGIEKERKEKIGRMRGT